MGVADVAASAPSLRPRAGPHPDVAERRRVRSSSGPPSRRRDPHTPGKEGYGLFRALRPDACRRVLTTLVRVVLDAGCSTPGGGLRLVRAAGFPGAEGGQAGTLKGLDDLVGGSVRRTIASSEARVNPYSVMALRARADP